MRIKFVPELIFRLDETAEKSAHMMDILRRIEEEKGAAGDDRS